MENATSPVLGDVRPHIDETLLLLQTTENKLKLTKYITVMEYNSLVKQLNYHSDVETRAYKDLLAALKLMKKNREECLAVLNALREKVNAKREVSRGENGGHD